MNACTSADKCTHLLLEYFQKTSSILANLGGGAEDTPEVSENDFVANATAGALDCLHILFSNNIGVFFFPFFAGGCRFPLGL